MLEQCDALEFVNKLEGGWDCIVLDPPYLNENAATIEIPMKTKTAKWKAAGKIHQRLLSDILYVEELKKQIIQKAAKQGFWIEFYNKRRSADYIINWYKGSEYGGMGGYVKRNTEYIMITAWNNMSPNPIYPLFETEEHKRNGQALTKPISLYQRLFQFCDATYILDPFAGSFNSARAAIALGLKVDACDKYLEPKVAQKTLYDILT